MNMDDVDRGLSGSCNGFIVWRTEDFIVWRTKDFNFWRTKD